VEHNAAQLTGVVLEITPSYKSPAGVSHQEWLLEHRSRQIVAGQIREVKAQVVIKLTGAGQIESHAGVAVGHRIHVKGLLAQASYRDTQQLLIHAQVIERIE
jgi:primosomal replication protein N